MKHAGQEIKNPRKLNRLGDRIYRTGKPGLIDIMLDLGVSATRREAAQAYDAVTAAINAWMLALTRDLPKDLHAKLLLRDCFSVNVCWMRGGKWPDYPKLWIIVGDRRGKPGIRSQLRRLKLREYAAWKERQK